MLQRRAALALGLPALPAAWAQPACGGPYEVGLGVSGHLAYEEGPRREPAALLVDLVREWAQRSRLPLQPGCYPIPRLVRMMQGGELPLFGLRRWTPASAPQIEPLLVAAPLLWVQASRSAATLEELLADPKVVFGRLGSGTVNPWVDAKLDALPAQRIELSLDASAMLRKLVVGRVQAVVSMPLMQRVMEVEDYPWQRLHARSLPEAGTSVGGLELNPARICGADAQRLRQHLRRLRDDGSLYRLLRKHLGQQAQPWMVWKR